MRTRSTSLRPKPISQEHPQAAHDDASDARRLERHNPQQYRNEADQEPTHPGWQQLGAHRRHPKQREPNDQAQQAHSEEGTSKRHLFRELAQTGNDRHEQHGGHEEGTARNTTRLHSGVSPGLENWIGTGAGTSGLAYNYVVKQHAAGLSCTSTVDELENDQLYSRLLDEREGIEASFGEPLDWQPLPGRRACRINFDVAKVGYKDEEQWPELHAKMTDAMVRLERSLKPVISAVR